VLKERVPYAGLVAALLTALALLIAVPQARGNFVYWANEPSGSIGRAKINGSAANDNFITGLDLPEAVAVDSKFVYWAEGGTPDRIGRANLDGTGVNRNFITSGVSSPLGIAVTANSGIYWLNRVAGNPVGHANIDGSTPVGDLFQTGSIDPCGLGADQSFVYWLNTSGDLRIGRAALSGAGPDPNFITIANAGCGVTADPTFLYWDANDSIGRAPVGGGSSDAAFIPAAAAGAPCGVAVNSQYVFWGNLPGPTGSNFVGRANINGSAPNPKLIAGLGQPCGLAAAPSNKITVNSVATKKKKGTATIDAKVSGPGQVTLNQVNTPPDVNAVASGVKQVGLTIPQASSFKLAVKPVGKTAKKLSKQIKKQLRKKRKAKAKANVTAFIHFVPAGVAGVPNTQQLTVVLVKQRTKKKK
jgi:hypothetical protein